METRDLINAGTAHLPLIAHFVTKILYGQPISGMEFLRYPLLVLLS